MSYFTQIAVQNFRSYEAQRLQDLHQGLIVITGQNGVGKTNILEAVSLLSPGRGLRGVKANDLQRHQSPHPWGITGKLQDKDAIQNQIMTGLNPQTGRRIVKINGVELKSQAALSDYVACLWLTPQMDRLFLDGASERRRFLDRMIFSFDPSHAGRVTRYENAMRSRSKLLQEGQDDPVWLKSLEQQMVEAGIAVSAARLEFIERLHHFSVPQKSPFPKANLSVTGAIETLLQKSPAIEVEQSFLYQLEQSRPLDAKNGGAATGPHKSDMDVLFATKNMPAKLCSTGEQKALLIGLVLAHAMMIMADRRMVPILLLDEIAAHLDEGRRGALFSLLQEIGGQVWMTGTDPVLFSAIEKQAQFFVIQEGQIEGQSEPSRATA